MKFMEMSSFFMVAGGGGCPSLVHCAWQCVWFARLELSPNTSAAMIYKLTGTFPY